MYDYQKCKEVTNTDDGIRAMIRMREKALTTNNWRKEISADELMSGVYVGTNWDVMACIDRLVELRMLRVVHADDMFCRRTFIAVT